MTWDHVEALVLLLDLLVIVGLQWRADRGTP